MRLNLVLVLALLLLLLLNFVFLRLLGQPFDTNFWIQIGTGMIPNVASILIALFVVDVIISARRRNAYGELNNAYSQRVAYHTNRLLLELLQVLGLEDKEGEKDKAGKLNDIGEKIVSDIGLDFVIENMRGALQSGKFGEAILSKSSASNFTDEVQKIEAVFKKNMSDIKEHLSQLKPQAARWVHAFIEEKTTELEGILSIAVPMDRDIFQSETLSLTPEQLVAFRESYLVTMGNRLMRWCAELCEFSEKARRNKLFEVIG